MKKKLSPTNLQREKKINTEVDVNDLLLFPGVGLVHAEAYTKKEDIKYVGMNITHNLDEHLSTLQQEDLLTKEEK